MEQGTNHSPSPPMRGSPIVSSPVSAAPFRSRRLKFCIGCRIQSGGSRDCKHCGISAYKRQMAKLRKFGIVEPPGVVGLHSSWVTDYALGMQRLNQNNLGVIIDRFEECKIGAVFNLTQPGEHPLCGHELLASGFSYNPEDLMMRGIKYFNYNWEDMNIPSMDLLLLIVQTALHEINENGVKVALHCHAGYGRTGTAIACIMIAKEGISAESAINKVRVRRPGSIQTRRQFDIVCAFESRWKTAKVQFNSVSLPMLNAGLVGVSTPTATPIKGAGVAAPLPALSPSPSKSIARSLDDSRLFHSLAEKSDYPTNRYGSVAKVVALCTSSLVRDCEEERGEGTGKTKCESLLAAPTALAVPPQAEQSLAQAKESVNSGTWDSAQISTLAVSVRVTLILDWLMTRSDAVLAPSQQSEEKQGKAFPTPGFVVSPIKSPGKSVITGSVIVRVENSPTQSTLPLCEGLAALSAALGATLHTSHLHVLASIVQLLVALHTSLGLAMDVTLPDAPNGHRFLAGIAVLARALLSKDAATAPVPSSSSDDIAAYIKGKVGSDTASLAGDLAKSLQSGIGLGPPEAGLLLFLLTRQQWQVPMALSLSNFNAKKGET
jgi:hypothetical protein